MSQRYLSHYGVLGMKWGIRKQEEPANPTGAKGKLQLTDKQKRYLKIGATAVTMALVAYGGYKISKNLDVPGLIQRSKDNKSVKSILLGVNPNYTTDPSSPLFMDTNMNCGLTTIAEELTMRGEKVHARMNGSGMYPEQIGAYFEGLHSKSVSSLDFGDFGDVSKMTNMGLLNPLRGIRVQQKLQKHILSTFPKGSRGNMYVPHIAGNHFISFEHLGDRVRFDNPQNPNLNLTKWFYGVVTKGTPGADRYGGVRITRLDDLKVKDNLIDEIITNRKDDLRDRFKTNIIKGEGFVMNMF